MVRPREFDEQEVLDAATLSFWAGGYESTSVRSLADRMGMTSASLYNAFGDKRELYRLVLDRYVEAGLKHCAEAFEEELPPMRALSCYFDDIIAEALNDSLRKGCLLVNASMELAPHDDEFREAVTRVFCRIEKYLRDCVQAGQSDGTILNRQSADDLGRLLLGTLLAIRVLARTRPEADLLVGMTRPVFQLLQTP
jgi:TetR/AcrR family transcriptional repressor of nem operon